MKFEVPNRKKKAFLGLRTSNSRPRFSFLKSIRRWLIVPAVAIVVIGLRTSGVLQLVEWAAFDQMIGWRPVEPVDQRIVLVTIDEPDIQQIGQWPIPDATLAQLIEKLKQQQPLAIGLDIYRDLPVPPGHQELLETYRTTPNLIGIEKVGSDANGSAVAPPPVLKEQNQVSAVDLVWDGDGKIRRALLTIQPPGEETVVNIGLQLALMYLQAQGITPETTANGEVKLGQGVFTRFTGNDGAYVRADAGGYQVLLNYRGLLNHFLTVSVSDILAGRVSPNLMRDRIVLIGTTAESLNDLFFTPYSSNLFAASERTPGVVIHANIASQILSSALDGRPLFKVWSEPIEWLWILLWSGVGMTIGLSYRPTKGMIRIILAAVSLTVICYQVFLRGWWIPMIPPLLALVGSGTAITGYIANQERQERQTLMNLFGRHLTPKIADEIWRSRDELLTKGQLLGQKMTATILFADIQDFSAIAETMEPDRLMFWLNEYMNTMADIVLSHDGIIDKFIGDAIMAAFGVPLPRTHESEIAQDAILAVSSAVAMAEQLRSLNRKWRQNGQPTVSMRIGIATGVVVTGSLGSSQRMDYTTLGDTVNVAARLESYDKSFGQGLCRILISESTYHYVQDLFSTNLVGHVQLKGRQKAVDIYQVLGIK
ncbi:MAG: adenylate/guanylate cyclase domain-containing protein [Lyngbya sp.]|nr:adenylate/guanylate cyclase domain-containing protein [Lyngbya sp.]